MQKNLTIILIILLYSCGDDSSTNPPSIDYYTDDQQFIDNLVLLNNSIENENVIERITATDFIDGSTGSKYYKIKQLNLNNMSLDSIPNSIINLDSLKILNLSNNQIEFLPEDICNINDQLDSLDVSNNLLCNPHVPICITNIEPTLTAFFASQNGCSYQMSPKDRNFIKRMILENWTAVSENDSEYDSLWTILNDEDNITWQEFTEEDIETLEPTVVSRIVTLKYEGFNSDIGTIPPEIGAVDSLKFMYLSHNDLSDIPTEIGDLKRLQSLYLDHNKIEIVPESIGGGDGLKKLEHLILNDNQIDSVYTHLSYLTSLTKLDLSRNNLETLPSDLCGFSPVIKIVGNQFKCVCTSACGCTEWDETCFDAKIIDQSCEDCGD
jgi:Leucine-rich repeat (LRR) protein